MSNALPSELTQVTLSYSPGIHRSGSIVLIADSEGAVLGVVPNDAVICEDYFAALGFIATNLKEFLS